MAITATLSQAELQRVAQLAYEGIPLRVSLANDPGSTLSSESTRTACDALKLSGNGYADFRAILSVGTYDLDDQRYELPYVDASFTATGAGYSYNSIYIVFGSLSSVALSTVAVASSVVTMTTGASHGLTTGDIIHINTTPDGIYEGFKTVTGTPSSTSFTFSMVAPDSASASITGTVGKLTEKTYLHSLLIEDPLKTLAAGQTQTYRILLATDN